MSVYEKLMKVQGELIAPKGQYNSFGKYNYRSCEDILNALKPLLGKVGATVTITDEPVFIGDRYYIKATASFIDIEDGSMVSNSALARESSDKKGMDESQITGTASSYARKYALNGLFLIDDTKDADTDSYHEQTNKSSKKQDKSDEQKNAEMVASVDSDLLPDPNRTPEYRAKKIKETIAAKKQDEKKLMENAKVDKWENLTDAQFVALMGWLAKK